MTHSAREFFVGVDLGQSRDFTAIAVLERVEDIGPRDPATYELRREPAVELRYLERVPLGTPYPEVVDRVARVAQSAPLAGRCELAVDGTGVGRPVVDLLERARPGCPIRPVILTSGSREGHADGYYHVPKRDLITQVQVLLQSGKLRIAAGLRYAGELVAELTAMQSKVTAAGNEQFGAWRQGTHDDLVLAVALACWGADKFWGWLPQRPQRRLLA